MTLFDFVGEGGGDTGRERSGARVTGGRSNTDVARRVLTASGVAGVWVVEGVALRAGRSGVRSATAAFSGGPSGVRSPRPEGASAAVTCFGAVSSRFVFSALTSVSTVDAT